MPDDLDNESLVIAYGGRAYMAALPHVSVPYLFILGPAAGLGTIGNAAVLAGILLNHNLHKPQSVFLVSLALADLVVNTVMDPLSILGEYRLRARAHARDVSTCFHVS